MEAGVRNRFAGQENAEIYGGAEDKVYGDICAGGSGREGFGSGAGGAITGGSAAETAVADLVANGFGRLGKEGKRGDTEFAEKTVALGAARSR